MRSKSGFLFKKRYFIILMGFLFSLSARGQQFHAPYVETIKRAQSAGITIEHLDSLYKSAIHVDSSKAVFKAGGESDSLTSAYQRFLQGLGKYLRENNFKWEKQTRCWNRIYFKADGSVEYYLFDFKTDIGDEKTERFKELFRSYATTHKIGISARVNFAQCSPVVYMDK